MTPITEEQLTEARATYLDANISFYESMNKFEKVLLEGGTKQQISDARIRLEECGHEAGKLKHLGLELEAEYKRQQHL